MGKPCPFCRELSALIASNRVGSCIFDRFPITPGHALVIPRRHVSSLFDLSKRERDALMDLVALAKKRLDELVGPAGYNIGVNDGPAAGQTVPHLHIHLIPRYPGDRPDPRGGVRWLFPEKADYWTRP